MKTYLGCLPRPQRLGIFFLFIVLAFGAGTLRAVETTAQIQSQSDFLWTSGSWSNGVPSAGDIAIITTPAPTIVVPTLGVAGELRLGGSAATFEGAGGILMDDPTSLAPRLSVSARRIPFTVNFDTPLGVASAQQLTVDVGLAVTLNVSNGLMPGDGGLVKRGVGLLEISGPTPGLFGPIEAAQGVLSIPTPADFQSGLDAIVSQDGVLRLGGGANASLTVNGGELSISGGAYAGSINLAPLNSGTIVRPVNPDSQTPGPTTISSSITGSGNLKLMNSSTDEIVLSGNSDFTGYAYLQGGDYAIASATALGATSQGTTIIDATVRVQAPVDEAFRVESGTLWQQSGGSLSTNPVVAGGTFAIDGDQTVATSVVLEGDAWVRSGAYFKGPSWTGGVTGTGTLSLGGGVQVDGVLAHNGGVVLSDAILNSANTYTGDTMVVGDAIINHPEAFGASASPIVVSGFGSLVLNVAPAGAQDIVLNDSELVIGPGAAPIENTIIMSDVRSSHIEGAGVFNGVIQIHKSQSVSGRHSLSSGVFNGPIRGDASLSIGLPGETVVLNSANEMTGVVLAARGTIVVNHEDALSMPNIELSGALLEMNVPAASVPVMTGDGAPFPVLKLNVAQEFAGKAVVTNGTLEAAAAVEFDDVFLRDATTTSSGGGRVTVNGALIATGADTQTGTLTGDGDIRAVGRRLTIRGDLTGFAGDIHLKQGVLGFSPIRDSQDRVLTNPETDIHVYSNTTLDIPHEDKIIPNDIHLHNAHGPLNQYEAGITVGNYAHSPVFAGNLNIGEHGARISGSAAVAGEITGRNLLFQHGGLDIQSPQHSLQGVLQMSEAALSFSGEGEIGDVDSILLTHWSYLYLSESHKTDRVKNDVVVRSRGGSIGLVSSPQQVTTETLGTVRMERGETSLFVSSDHGSRTASLVIESLEREAGALMTFDRAGPISSAQVNNLPTFDGHMIGGWAVYDYNAFAAIDENNNIVPLAVTSTDLNSAGEADHVQSSNDVVLDSDKSITSLRIFQVAGTEPLDLGGNRLNIRSGGLSGGYDIANGQLTAGDANGGELVAREISRISASITDNEHSGSVSFVTKAERGGTRLTGDNSYTGGTWVVGIDGGSYAYDTYTLLLGSFDAVPENDKVHIAGGNYSFLGLGEGVIKIDELHLYTGRVTGHITTLDADMYYLEDGQIYAPLSGSGTIYKTTWGRIDLDNEPSPEFTGKVFVQDGVFTADDKLPNAEFHVQGGILDGGNAGGPGSKPILLDGGTLGGSSSANIQVLSPSGLLAERFSSLQGDITGASDLTVRGKVTADHSDYVALFGDLSEYSGDLIVESGALQISSTAIMGPGAVRVEEGAELLLYTHDFDDPPLNLANEVHLDGGALYNVSRPSFFQSNVHPSVLSGDVHVHSYAFVGTETIAKNNGDESPAVDFQGRLILHDNAFVYGLTNDNGANFGATGRPHTAVSGKLLVGESTVWNTGLGSLLLSGEIVADSADASIDFQGFQNALMFESLSLDTGNGNRLSILQNGALTPLDLSGPTAGARGSGVIGVGLTLSDGAILSPGESPGTLTIDGDTTLGPGAVYVWEPGAVGSPSDMLLVQGELSFDATPELPWVLEIPGLTQDALPSPDGWVIAIADTLTGFDPGSVEIRLPGSNNSSLNPLSNSRTAYLLARGDQIVLYVIPEPGTLSLILVASLSLISSRKRTGRGTTRN